ncbi:MAG: ribokinase [Bacteroidetes bacterium]|nr:ribokinase [Bacteroidota bacterium]
MMKQKIVVVGSSNTDMVVKAHHFPQPGETILGGDFYIFQGGKGANQAVASARLGGEIVFICRVGNDAFGNSAIQHYQQEGIDVSAVAVDHIAPTGVALITLNAEGENTIVVASGANAILSKEDIENAGSAFNEAGYIITQLETPIPAIEYLAMKVKAEGKKLILNPAPAASIPAIILDGLFLITPNESETAMLTGIHVKDGKTAKEAVNIFKTKGVQNVIITLGSKGAYVACSDFEGFIPAYKVKAVDTTAAGDVFNGALVVALAEGRSWKDAVEFASKAAAISVTKLGAQTSAPYLNEIITFN